MFTLSWMMFVMLFFWGILIPPLGNIPNEIAHKQFELWQIGILGSLLGFLLFLFIE
jgi:hypothetical protein